MTAGALDLGSITALVTLDDAEFQVGYARVTRQFTTLGSSASKSAAGASELDASLTGVASSSNAAATSLTRAARATSEAGLSASKAAAASDKQAAATQRTVDVTTEAGLAQSKNTQAVLRASAAQERYDALQASGTATTRQLASAQASLIAANDRVALSSERVGKSQMLGAQTADRMKGVWAAIPGPVKAAATAVAAVGVGSLVAASKFQTATMRIHTQADATVAQTNAIRKGILGMSASVGTMPTVLADAAYHIASVGQKSLSTAQQLDVLRTAAEGAKLGNANLTDVTNALDAAIVANMKGVANYSQVMGVMNATVGAGDMTMQNFADAFGPLGSTFKGFGVSIQQAGAALAVFGDNNIRGTLAGSQLRQSITALAVPLKAGQDQLKAWGITSGNLSAQLQKGGLTAALDLLKQKMTENGVTASQMGPKLAEMFGKRGPQQGLSTLLNELDRYHNKLGIITAAGDSFSSKWTAYTHTLGFAWDRIKSGADAAAIAIGNRLLPGATKALSWFGTTGVAEIGKFWHAFSSNSLVTGGFSALQSALHAIGDTIRNVVVAVGPFAHALAAVAGGVALGAFRALAEVVDGVAHALSAVTGFFASNRAAAVALAGAITGALLPSMAAWAAGLARIAAIGVASVVSSIAAAVGAMGAAFTEAEGGVAGFGAALTTLDLNPVGLGLAAIGATVGALIYGFTHMSGSVAQAQDSIKQWTQGLDIQQNSAKSYLAALDAMRAKEQQLSSERSTAQQQLSKGGIALPHLTTLTAQLDQLHSSFAQTKSDFTTMQDHARAVATALHLPVTAVYALANSIGANLTGNVGQLVVKLGAAAAAARLSHHPTQQAASDFRQMGQAGQSAADDITHLDQAWDNLVGNWAGKKAAIATAVDSIHALDKALKASNGSVSANSAAGRAAAIQMKSTTDSVKSAIDSIFQAQGHWTKSGVQSVHGLIDAMTSGFPKGSAAGKHMTDALLGYMAHLAAQAPSQGKKTGSGVSQGIASGLKPGQASVNGLAKSLSGLGAMHPRPTVSVQTSQAMAAIGHVIQDLQSFASHAWTAVVNIVTHGSATPPTTPKLHPARGGLISGPGTGTSDSIPAMVSDGEFVVNARATARNLALLREINAQHFAAGGLVGSGGGSFAGKQSLGGGTGGHSGSGGGNDGTLQGAVRSAVQTVYRAISAALYQLPTDPTALSDILRRQTAGAVAQERTLPGLKKTYDDLKAKAKEAAHAANQLSNAQGQDAAAAKKHAQSLSDAASKAHQLAANMNGTGKAASAAKAAAEKHARALDQEARKASEAATAISNANGKKAKSAQAAAAAAQKAADKAKAAYDKESQAAQAAAQKAAQTAQALIQSLQSQADALKQSVTDFQTSISQGITGDYSLTTIWQSLTGTDANGNPMNPTLEQLQKSLDGILANAKQFAADLTKLVADGAGQDLITQLTQMGTTAGDALAQQLLAAGPGAITALQSTMGQINDVATTEAQQLGRAFFGAGADMMIELLKGLEHAFPDLKRGLQPIIRELAGMFGSSPSPTPTGTPSKPPSWLTKPSVPAFAAGGMSLGGLALVGERGPEYVSLPAGAQVWRHGTSPRGSDGASLGDVVTRLERIEAAVIQAPDRLGEVTLGGYREAGKSQAREMGRNRRAGR